MAWDRYGGGREAKFLVYSRESRKAIACGWYGIVGTGMDERMEVPMLRATELAWTSSRRARE